MIIPTNHPVHPFPLNLEDRIEDRSNKVNEITEQSVSIKVTKEKDGIFMNKRNKDYPKYVMEFKNTKSVASSKRKLEQLGFKLDSKGIWSMIIE